MNQNCTICLKKVHFASRSCCICCRKFHVKCLKKSGSFDDRKTIFECCTISCLLTNLPFYTIDDHEFDVLLSGLNDEMYHVYKVCNSLTFETNRSLETNQFNFDDDLNSEKHFFEDEMNLQCKYYLDEEFNSEFGTNYTQYGLKIFHLNCRSLLAHFDDILSYLENLVVKFDILALSETWLIEEKHDIQCYKIDDYDMYTCCRSEKKW